MHIHNYCRKSSICTKTTHATYLCLFQQFALGKSSSKRFIVSAHFHYLDITVGVVLKNLLSSHLREYLHRCPYTLVLECGFKLRVFRLCSVSNSKALLALVQHFFSPGAVISAGCFSLSHLPISSPLFPVITRNCFSAPNIIHAGNLSFVIVRKINVRLHRFAL